MMFNKPLIDSIIAEHFDVNFFIGQKYDLACCDGIGIIVKL